MKRILNVALLLSVGAFLLAGLSGCGKKDTTVHPTAVSLNKTSLALTVGEEETLTAVFTPSDVTNKNVTWSSGNPSVASVSNGKVTAIAKGTTNITVTSEDGGLTATCLVSVDNVHVSGVTIEPAGGILLKVGETRQLSAKISPANAFDPSVSWSSSSDAIATVSSNGLVTAVSSGVATVKVTTVDGGLTAETTVSVAGLTLSETEISVYSGYRHSLTASMVPGSASASSLSVSSSDESVATVSVADDGSIVILAVKKGSATITVTAKETGLTATCAVTVKDSGGSSFEDENYGDFK